jgi:hypothetical protein
MTFALIKLFWAMPVILSHMRKMRSSREAAEKDLSETEQIDKKNDIQMGEYCRIVIYGFHT